jgi:hypothetical protein
MNASLRSESKMDFVHKRTLNISLLIIEKRLQKLQEILVESKDVENVQPSSTSSSSSPLSSSPSSTATPDSIDPDTRISPINTIKAMQNEIALLRSEFQVPVEDEPVSSRRQMLSALTEVWSILDDLRPSVFDSYGRIEQEDRKKLERHISKLRKMADEFYSMMDNRRH